MKLDLMDMLYALSYGLDRMEDEIGGISTSHGKNVGYMSYLLGKEYGYTGDELTDLVGLGVLHDNAFSEYIREEYGNLVHSNDIKLKNEDKSLDKYLYGYEHSLMGEAAIKLVPFKTDTTNVIKYHHENANGSGPFKMKAKDTPIKAQIIHIVDIIDVKYDIKNVDQEIYDDMVNFVNKYRNKLFSDEVVDLFIKGTSLDNFIDIKNNTVEVCLRRDIETKEYEYTDKEIKNLARFFANIVDYKSSFTKNHSLGVAKKCEVMAKYYNFDKEKSIKFYLAGALHDIGKLCIPNTILEKEGKLTKEEFAKIKNHAYMTHEILKNIKDFDDIHRWASNHHERLDGTGYPKGLKEDELSFEDKLLAEIDIYQALVEKRPYKEGLSHEVAIQMMKQMAYDGKIDSSIIDDINKVLGK